MSALTPIDRRVAREAARWMLHLSSGQASLDDTAACERWRARSAMHEQAWQRAQQIRHLLGGLPPELARATLGRPNGARRTALKTLAALIIAPPVAWAAWRGGEASGLLADARSAVGERRALTLADGTPVRLNSGSAVDLTADGLLLRQGEVYVQAGATPSVIASRSGEVRARLARYSLRLLDSGARLTLYQGQAWLQPRLHAGQTLSAPAAVWFDATTLHPLAPPTDAEPAWTRGVLHAAGLPLAEFATELARHRAGLVRCDPAVAALRVSGVFQLDNTDGILRALPALLPVSVRYRSAYWVVIGPREA
ncbi:DUF4880 domain-containing protein [Bordetella trematum]|uniref:DUF4880 domain-containing protein n=1 Tax=Bordetella trematum TaxID=123899 RepID=UPI0015C54BCD|nr:DUF4880 domain-containing protein [Bordetella trematum]